ncbi:MAG: isoprenylcysteine carboxylmethyltransferase family protein [Gemmatimonadaceae bacterium]|nr:isoprenylcysteine carboxylmethyltransferase family protein [Gemmatimonadaceae bacterium]
MTKPPVSAQEQSRAAQVGAVLFRNRGWLPVPFLLIPLLVPGQITPTAIAVAAVLIVIGEGWRLWGVATAGTVTRRRSRDVQTLVTHGPFNFSRNPLYNGNYLIWMGFVALSGVWWFLPVATVLFAVEYHFIVAYEEGVLESIFGEAYLSFKRRTPRWIPSPAASPSTGDYRWAEAWRSEISTFLQYAALIVVFVLKDRYRPGGVL